MEDLLGKLGKPFGVLAQGDTTQLEVIAHNEDVAVGDLFIMPSSRGGQRFYLFRTSQYANVMNRTIDISDVARNKLTMPDANLSEDLVEEKLLSLRGMLLGYAEQVNGNWIFLRPRRLPEHLTYVYLVDETNAQVLKTILESQLGQAGLFLGYLLAGERALAEIPVYIPPHALSHHIGIFGRTGSGKSNLMMQLIGSMIQYNRQVDKDKTGPKVSMLAIDPHDEFCHWPSGGGGIAEIFATYNPQEWGQLVAPFFYLTVKEVAGQPGKEKIHLSWADITPQDLFSIMDFSEQQMAFANQHFQDTGERWVRELLTGATGQNAIGAQYLPGTVNAVERRVNFLRTGQTHVFTPHDPATGREYISLLPDILCALESGRVITIDTTLMNEVEQFLITTVIARTLFTLRKALRSARNASQLEREVATAFGYSAYANGNGGIGLKTFAEKIIEAIQEGRLPYIKEGALLSVEDLPFINVVIEEAPSVLNPDRLKFGSVFRDISRQGRKFGIGLTVISQQVTAIDEGILTQLNTEITMALGNEQERREAIKNASADLFGFEKELQVMGRGQVMLTATYKDVPLPVQVPRFSVK